MRHAWLLIVALPLGCSLVRDLDGLESGASSSASSTTSSSSSSGMGGAGAMGGEGGSGGPGGGGMGGSGACPSFGDGGFGGDGGGPAPNAEQVGCSDGTRELFLDEATHPNIAGCSGGFSIPGTIGLASLTAACNRRGGNDGDLPTGGGCSVEDLCADGWHVCLDAAEVMVESGTGACEADGVGFYTSRQSQNDARQCVANGRNNLVGCGAGLGDVDVHATCAPLAIELREVHCATSCAWICDDPQLFDEAEVVQKYGPEDGGVLCCKDG